MKSSVSDELINTYLVRPLAGIFVRIFFSTRVTPNQLTIASTIVGCVGAFFYLDGNASHNIVAGLFVTLKDILDSADGQLARAKQQYSRIGRFLDSIGDYFVNLLVFGAITVSLCGSTHSPFTIPMGIIAFFGISMRVSCHVFYQTSFLHLVDAYKVNRVTEEIREEDLTQDTLTLQLQCVFQFLYGWQDRLMMKIDEWCRTGLQRNQQYDEAWYGDKIALRISGLMGLGTELFVLMMFSVMNQLELYLYVNIIALNAIWLCSIAYRRFVLKRRIYSRTLVR